MEKHMRVLQMAYLRSKRKHVRSMIHMTVSDTMARPGSKIVEGDVLKTEREYDIVRQRSRQDARLQVDETAHLEGGAFRVRDKLEAYVTDRGHVRYRYHYRTRVDADGPGVPHRNNTRSVMNAAVL